MAKRTNWIFWSLVGATAVGTAQVVLRYQAWKQATLARLKAGAQLAETAAGPVEYATLGEGPAVLVLHGSPGGYDQGLVLARAMGPEGYRYVAVSRPGYLGTSLTVGATPEEQADACAALLDVLETPHAAVIAVSGGGPAALQFALRHANRCTSLAMISAVSQRWVSTDQSLGSQMMDKVLNSDPGIWLFTAILASQATRLAPVFAEDYPEFPSHIVPDPEKLQLFTDMMNTLAPASPRRDGFQNDYAELNHMPVYPLEQIAVPTLVVHGTRDHNVPFAHAEFVAQTVPGAVFHTIEGADHTCFIARRQEVRDLLAALLERSAADGG